MLRVVIPISKFWMSPSSLDLTCEYEVNTCDWHITVGNIKPTTLSYGKEILYARRAR